MKYIGMQMCIRDRYYGGSFYNMFHYGADTDYDRELVRYLLEQGEVKRIVLVPVSYTHLDVYKRQE